VDRQDIRKGVIASIKAIAPEVDESELLADRPLREQVDLDSMDWLNIIVSLHERFGIDISEGDYAKLATLDAIISYVAERVAPHLRAGGE